MLRDVSRNRAFVFGGNGPYQDIKTAFKSALRRAGLPQEVRVHDLRHTPLSRLTAAGADPMTLKAVSRHRSYKMLERYVYGAEKQKREAVELLARVTNRPPHYPPQ